MASNLAVSLQAVLIPVLSGVAINVITNIVWEYIQKWLGQRKK